MNEWHNNIYHDQDIIAVNLPILKENDGRCNDEGGEEHVVYRCDLQVIHKCKHVYIYMAHKRSIYVCVHLYM